MSAAREVTVTFTADVSEFVAATERAAAEFRRVASEATRSAMRLHDTSRLMADLLDPPSPERLELRLIARAERAEALLWWERHKARGRR